MTSYNAAETIALLHKVVESKGSDYFYPEYYDSGLGCYYAKDGEPSCIVGHVLFELGVPVSAMTYSEDETEPSGNLSSGTVSTLFETLNGEYGIYFTPAARHALSAAQATQDARFTWGEALAQAENAAAASLRGELTE